jgi:hypoxanthine phosphoribosyltransferase
MALLDDGGKPKFAHPSEAEFAQILDYYQIRWEYEPQTFSIGEDEAFSPDFFLPDFNLFIELTTAKQALIGYKRRKVRLLKEHHPDVNIKLLTRDDFLKMIDKYGLEDDETGLIGKDAHGGANGST